MGLTALGRRLAHLPPRSKLYLLLTVDGVMLPLCAVASLMLVDDQPTITGAWLLRFLAIGLATQAVLFATGLYRSVVRFIDHHIVVRTAIGLALPLAALWLVWPWLRLGIERSMVLIYWLVAFDYLMTSRFIARSILLKGYKRSGRPRRRTLVYGAADAGVPVLRAMSFGGEFSAVCFIDEAPRLRGRTVAGLPVYGPDDLADAIARHEVEMILVALPSANAAARHATIRRLEGAGLPVKVLPALVELVEGRADIRSIRDIDVTDLLGRDPVPPDPSLFGRNLKGKSVLVTGAGGSIGSELCRQVLSQAPQHLVLLDHSEYNLYSIEQELRSLQPGVEISAVLGSVLDDALLERTLRRFKVQTCYHAAAYKHVPIVEENVRQGVVNNVFGSLAVARTAARCGLETCVLVSTDKAVRPTNIMGASKRIAELVFQGAAVRRDHRTVFSMVRFGNVLGSSGSVVPLFKKQIEAGGPITITHPDVVRYFMLIPEAAQLVIQAGAMAKGGEVFVLDMGEPVRIADLARTMIDLAGLTERNESRPDGDIEVRFIGLRPGEKLYEELLIGDRTVAVGHPRIMCALERHIDPALLDKMLASLQSACQAEDDEAIVRQVSNLVPEYAPADGTPPARPFVERRATARLP